jgi:hypothetical protein
MDYLHFNAAAVVTDETLLNDTKEECPEPWPKQHNVDIISTRMCVIKTTKKYLIGVMTGMLKFCFIVEINSETFFHHASSKTQEHLS